MDERMNLGTEVKELKLGSTFNTSNPRNTPLFHTLKYDFKPASVDSSKVATLDVSSNNQVTVTVPHLDSSGVPKTVFKGNQRNYTKECVIIIDKVTGEITLEKLHHNIQVKKTRSENTNKQVNLPTLASASSRASLENSTQRTISKTKVSTGVRKSTLGGIVQRHSPMQGSPSYPHHKSPQQAPAWNANNTQSTLPSIPLIGMDDDVVPSNMQSSPLYQQQYQQPPLPQQIAHPQHMQHQQTLQSQYQPPVQRHHTNNASLMHNQQAISSGMISSQQPVSIQHQHIQANQILHQQTMPQSQQQQFSNDVGVLSSSDSSSDSWSSDSGSDSDDNEKSTPKILVNNHHSSPNSNNNQNATTGGSLPALLLHEDLRLSESNSSDSDD